MTRARPAVAAAPDREDALDQLADRSVDVLVVGGGITGAGIALDAVTRGYSVALVEREDLAAGTSSRSSKLIHGGVRYLARGDLPMVAEGVRERDRLRRLAPHLVVPLPFTLATPTLRTRVELKAGLTLYDALALGRNLHGHGRLALDDLLDHVPALSTGVRRGGYRYFDAQTDDARLTLQVAQTARRYGALVLPHTAATELLTFRGRIVGARLEDRLTGDELQVTARWVVAAGGVWADQLRRLAPDAGDARLVPSRGAHLTFDRRDLPVNAAAAFPSGMDDGRMNFAIPWGDQVYVGTTDDVHDGVLDRPAVAPADAHYLVESVRRAFDVDLGVEDAVGAWAGLRPLLSSGPGFPSADLSRRHAIMQDPPGLVSITGGKLTTYRQMAEDLVDRLADEDGNRNRCTTRRLPLGVRGPGRAAAGRVLAVAHDLGVDRTLALGVFHRHGDEAALVLADCVAEGDAEPLVEGLPYLRGEVRWAVRHELARTVDDVLSRRLRVSLRHRAAGGPAASYTADVLGRELGWSSARRRASVRRYLDAVAYERGPVPLPRGPETT